MAVVGDTIQGIASVATGANFDIRPPAGEEWVIHNIYYTANGWVYFRITDGTMAVQFDSDSSAGSRMGMSIHVTNTQYLRINNASGSTQTFAFDGIKTK